MARKTPRTVDDDAPAGVVRKAAASKPRAQRSAPAPVPAPAPEPEPEATGARALIRAGLKALGDVRGDMVARQTRVFELLLGIGQSPAWTAASKSLADARAAADPFSKFEDVFDQRVARSLERLGMPSPQALRELADRIEALTLLLEQQQPPQSPAAGARRR
ncbi:phasin family protein [Aquabacterium humicola]|uniref:phasin family protein n=1 Tax=Aquabacterium humicola TaxID=3237377 RepID=UPI002542E6B2|nr:phasin family protein [Rubrivivax pictus]